MLLFDLVFFFKQKTAYEMRISDWSSDVCSSDLFEAMAGHLFHLNGRLLPAMLERGWGRIITIASSGVEQPIPNLALSNGIRMAVLGRSEEHTSELQSLMRISYAVFCLKKKKKINESTDRWIPKTNKKPYP